MISRAIAETVHESEGTQRSERPFLGKNPHLAIFGAGAVGRSVAGWLAEAGLNVTLVARPDAAATIAQNGLRVRDVHTTEPRTIRVRTASRVTAEDGINVLFLCVKTYALDEVGALLAGARVPFVVALQNGVDNQKILPKYFPRIAYGVVSYNAWIDEAGVLGYQSKGPLVIGTPDGSLGPECREISALLTNAHAVPTEYTERFNDAAHTKMIVNLANAFQALIGAPLRPVSDRRLAQIILSRLLWEGVQITKAAGYREHRIPGLPPWWLMYASVKLPLALTRPAFDRALSKLTISSMAQDMLLRGGNANELESLNGHFVELADRHQIAAPINRGLYRLCKARFGPNFEPMDVRAVWAELRA
jgi:2-dehydropantoate 2-reductase